MMKRLLALLLLSLTAFSLSAKKKTVIENPYYEVRHYGIYTISKLELTPTETKLHLHITFLPGWWVKFTTSMFIQPEGKEKIQVTGIEKGEFDKEIYLQGVGDSTFIFTFPPLDKSVTTFDFGDFNDVYISGLSLENTKKGIRKKEQELLEKEKEAIAWIERETARSGEALKDFESPDFFKPDTARFIGYIKGYSPKLGKSTAIIYTSNELTREDFPVVLNIHPDGRFEAAIPLIYPSMPYMDMFDQGMTLYFEPGCTLGAVFDWNDFLEANRYRNQRWDIKNIRFYGPLAKINSDIKSVELTKYDWDKFETDVKNLPPQAFKTKAGDIYEENRLKIQEKAGQLSGNSLKILTNMATISYGYTLMDFIDMRSYYANEDTSAILKQPLPDDFYDFLQELPLDEQALLIPYDASGFINRLEYNKVLSSAAWEAFPSRPQKTFLEYLLEDEGIVLTENEKIIEDYYKIIVEEIVVTEEDRAIFDKLIKDNIEAVNTFHEKYESFRPKYEEKYLAPMLAASMNKSIRILKEWQLKDSAWENEFHLKPNFTSQLIKIRELLFTFENGEKEASEKIITGIGTYVKHPFLRSEAYRLFNEAYPEDGHDIYELPQTPAADLFRQMIEPFKGKYVLVDFWDIYCGPCISGIKNMKEKREKLKDSPHIAFVFITSTSGSPKDRYDTFVGEQGLEHTYRLSDDDYNRMRELFKFNGIPHYRTVNRKGEVLLKSISTHSFDYDFERLLHKEAAGN